MKKLITLSIILLHGCSCLGQGYNHNYLLGYQTGLDSFTTALRAKAEIDSFNFNVFSQVRKMRFTTAQANISDSAGNLLFYTNGCWIANAAGDTMLNGENLYSGQPSSYCTFGLPFANAGVALPFPDSSNKFALFYELDDVNVYPRNLYYSIIDMTLDSGRGAVTLKNQIAFSDSLTFGVTACKHANGRDWWIAVLKDSSDIIYTLLLTPSGIANVHQQHLGVPMHTSFASRQAFSPDGTKFAYTKTIATGVMPEPYIRDLRILDFDRCSGQFSIDTPPVVFNLNDSFFGVGLAFSANSRYLYTSKPWEISQFDLQATNIAASRQSVAWYDFNTTYGITNFAYLYLAANGKIYVSSTSSTTAINLIDQPDSAGMACNVLQHSVQTPCYIYASHVNHPNYYLGCDTTQTTCPCLITGINNVKQHDFKFSISPNPTNGSFKIIYLLPQNKSGTLQIFDINGKEVFRQNLSPWSTMQYISLPKLANGVYNCTITSNNERVHKKLVVLKE
ncbi:MAG TPA: T9SS type A sorting domain-containing protein [Bacteroidia bacterium]|nr:T9SS type A sorting domain-containing protein [Bacteroidia bacterium]